MMKKLAFLVPMMAIFSLVNPAHSAMIIVSPSVSVVVDRGFPFGLEIYNNASNNVFIAGSTHGTNYAIFDFLLPSAPEGERITGLKLTGTISNDAISFNNGVYATYQYTSSQFASLNDFIKFQGNTLFNYNLPINSSTTFTTNLDPNVIGLNTQATSHLQVRVGTSFGYYGYASNFSLVVTTSVVPEPSTLALSGVSCLFSLMTLARARRIT